MIPIKKIEKKIDERGWLAELLKKEDVEPKEFGQFFITVANPGVTKGNHYHERKREWFCVIKGRAELVLSDIKAKKEEKVILSEDNLQVAEIRPYIFHAITNIGEGELYVLVYTNEVFNPDDQDTRYFS